MRGVAEAGSGGGANDGYRGVATGLVVAAQFEGSLGSSGAMPGIATPSIVLFSGLSSPGLAGAERAGGTGSAPFAGPEVAPPGKGAGKGPIGVGVSPIIVRWSAWARAAGMGGAGIGGGGAGTGAWSGEDGGPADKAERCVSSSGTIMAANPAIVLVAGRRRAAGT